MPRLALDPRRLAVGGRGRCLVFVALAGCSFTEVHSWTDQVHPDGPCYEANLADGLDATSTDELHAAFACLDGGGALAPFRPVDAAWDTPTRDDVAGIVFARWVNDAELGGLSLGGLLDDARALLDDPDGLWDTLHLGLELIYGAPWPSLGVEVDPDDPAALDAGLLVPALPLVGDVATVLLDTPATRGPIEDLLRSDPLRTLARTLAGIAHADRAPLGTLRARWPDDLADLVARAEDPTNDRWAEASGNSLRDVVRWLVVRRSPDGRTVWDHVVTPALPILADPVARSRVRDTLADQVAQDTLTPLPAELAHLLQVDARGGTLGSEDTTALAALVRLLRNGNTDVDCRVDLGFTEIRITLGNLSVSLLTTFASLDPDTAEGGVALFGDLLGVSLTDDTLQLVADSGVCPVIDDQFVDDLHAIDRLVDPEVPHLLSVLLGVLGALDDHIPDLVDALSAAHDAGLVPPLEELLRDVGEGPLVTDMLALVPALLDPWSAYDPADFPDGAGPVTYDDVWTWAGDLLAADGPLPTLQPLLDAVLDAPETWVLVHRLGALAGQPDAEVRGLLEDLAAVIDADPTLPAADAAADLLADDASLHPALVLVEAEGLRGALVATSDGGPGPIPTVTAWTLDGTLDRVVATLDQLLHLLSPETR